jgi:hypothetical protein
LVLEENRRRWHQWRWIGWKEGTSNIEYISKIGENISDPFQVYCLMFSL